MKWEDEVYKVGTRKWFIGWHRSGTGGVLDAILVLLEKGAITRGKARELLEFSIFPAHDAHMPKAPWGELYIESREPMTGETKDERS